MDEGGGWFKLSGSLIVRLVKQAKGVTGAFDCGMVGPTSVLILAKGYVLLMDLKQERKTL